MRVHTRLGPGLLESAYEMALCHELAKRNVEFRRQVPMALQYDQIHLDCGYRLDLLVEEKVVVEIKSIDRWLPVHEAQLQTYLKASGYRLGLLLNFNVRHMRHGIRRRLNRST